MYRFHTIGLVVFIYFHMYHQNTAVFILHLLFITLWIYVLLLQLNISNLHQTLTPSFYKIEELLSSVGQSVLHMDLKRLIGLTSTFSGGLLMTRGCACVLLVQSRLIKLLLGLNVVLLLLPF